MRDKNLVQTKITWFPCNNLREAYLNDRYISTTLRETKTRQMKICKKFLCFKVFSLLCSLLTKMALTLDSNKTHSCKLWHRQPKSSTEIRKTSKYLNLHSLYRKRTLQSPQQSSVSQKKRTTLHLNKKMNLKFLRYLFSPLRLKFQDQSLEALTRSTSKKEEENL